MKKIRFAALLVILGLSVSCTTSYDAYGSPRQSVDPGVALAGVAAAGLVGYALSNNGDNRSRRSHRTYSSYNNHDRYNSYNSNRYSSYQRPYYSGNRGYYGGGHHYSRGYSHGGYSNCSY